MKLFYLAIITSFVVLTKGHTKIWNFTTNYDNPKNWNSGSVPCSKDRVIFPRKPVLITVLPAGVTFKEMILPRNGEIILSPGSFMEKVSEPKECDQRQGYDATFLASGSQNWYDASKWTTYTDFILNDFTTQNPVPHAHRVPCQSDDVIIPENSTFRIMIYDDMNIPLRSMTINGQSYSTEDFNDLRKNTKHLFFEGKGSLTINDNFCHEKSGCACNNVEDNIMQLICDATPPCEELKCSDPIRVEGHCCPLCGALLTVHHKPNFEVEKLRKELEYFLAKDYLHSISCYLFKTITGIVQLLCLDQIPDNEQTAKTILDSVTKILITDAELGIIKFDIETSQQWKSPGSGFGIAGLFGLLLAMFLVIFGVIGGISLYRKKRYPSLSFVRFDSDVGKIEMDLGTVAEQTTDPTDVPTSSQTTPVDSAKQRLFKNPLSGFKFSQSKQREHFIRENPLYGMDEGEEQ